MSINDQEFQAMQETKRPLIDTRHYFGYFQSLETLHIDHQECFYWRFYISGFSCDGTSCRILKWDRTYQWIPIDQGGKILVCGKTYDKRFWNH